MEAKLQATGTKEGTQTKEDTQTEVTHPEVTKTEVSQEVTQGVLILAGTHMAIVGEEALEDPSKDSLLMVEVMIDTVLRENLFESHGKCGRY